MKSLEVTVPNTGVEGQLEVIEVCVEPGDMLEVDDAVIVLESDKATVEVPSPAAGKVLEVKVSSGDKLANGDLIMMLEVEASADSVSVSEPETIEQVHDEMLVEASAEINTQEESGSIEVGFGGGTLTKQKEIGELSTLIKPATCMESIFSIKNMVGQLAVIVSY